MDLFWTPSARTSLPVLTRAICGFVKAHIWPGLVFPAFLLTEYYLDPSEICSFVIHLLDPKPSYFASVAYVGSTACLDIDSRNLDPPDHPASWDYCTASSAETRNIAGRYVGAKRNKKRDMHTWHGARKGINWHYAKTSETVRKLGYTGASVARFPEMTTASVNRMARPEKMIGWDGWDK